MKFEADLVVAVVTSPYGVLLLHRDGELPPAFFPGGRPERGEHPQATAQRGTYEETRLRVRAGKVIGRYPHPAHGWPVVFVGARPVDADDDADETVGYSLHLGWYSQDQVGMLMPDMPPAVRRYLATRIPER